MVAYKDGRAVRLVSRNGHEFKRRFPELGAAVAALPAHTLILDGEVTVFDIVLVSRLPLRARQGSPGAAVAHPAPRARGRGGRP
jgi:ATP-dependent DNA ligase